MINKIVIIYISAKFKIAVEWQLCIDNGDNYDDDDDGLKPGSKSDNRESKHFFPKRRNHPC